MSDSYRWYALQVKAGYEKRAMEALQDALQRDKLSEEVEKVVLPTEEVVEIKKGKKVLVEKKFMSGYLLVKARMSDKLLHTIRVTRDIIKFLGNSEKPIPVSEEEVNIIFKHMKEGTIFNKAQVDFNVGHTVKIIDGPFESFIGSVEDIDHEKQRVRVSVSIFGRTTPVDLEFRQVVKE